MEMLFSTSGFERFEDEACLFGVHSECLLVELCYKRIHIGKRRCNRLPRESTVCVLFLFIGVFWDFG